MYRPVLVTPPTIKPVTLAEAKAHCRVDHDDDDAKLTALIAAATSYADGWTGILGRCLVEQTWRQDYDGFVCWSESRHHGGRQLRLPLFPVIGVNSVTYIDALGTEQTVAAGSYTLKSDDRGAYVEFVSTYSFPTVSSERASVSVEYDAGYEAGGDEPLPDSIKHGLLLLIGHWYANRETVVVGVQALSVPMASEALFAPHRRIAL